MPTTPWTSPSTAVVTLGGDVAWTDANGLRVKGDANVATAFLVTPQTSDTVYLYGYGFAALIPPNATAITAIRLRTTSDSGVGDGNPWIVQFGTGIGSLIGSAVSLSIGFGFSLTDTINEDVDFQAALRGVLTVAQVRGANFGVSTKFQNVNGDDTIFVDAGADLQIDYTMPIVGSRWVRMGGGVGL